MILRSKKFPFLTDLPQSSNKQVSYICLSPFVQVSKRNDADAVILPDCPSVSPLTTAEHVFWAREPKINFLQAFHKLKTRETQTTGAAHEGSSLYFYVHVGETMIKRRKSRIYAAACRDVRHQTTGKWAAIAPLLPQQPVLAFLWSCFEPAMLKHSRSPGTKMGFRAPHSLFGDE